MCTARKAAPQHTHYAWLVVCTGITQERLKEALAEALAELPSLPGKDWICCDVL